MKRSVILALTALLLTPAALFAQKNGGLGQKWGDYEIKLGKGKWTSESPVSAIWDNATKKWVSSPVIDKKDGALFFLPTSEVEFLQGEKYVPEAQGLVEVFFGFRWGKSVDSPTAKWLCNGHCGIFRIENDQLVPIVESGNRLEQAMAWEARYAVFRVIPGHALILGRYHPNDKAGYSIFTLDGERIYDDLKDLVFKGEPSVKIQLEDGSWHYLDPADGHMLD